MFIVIPNNVRKIEEYALSLCPKLEKVVLPQNLKEISEKCFWNSKISEIHVPRKVKIIEDGAFSECKHLINVTFEEDSRLSEIESEAFQKCSSLKMIVVPKGVRTIADDAFEKTTSIIKPSAI